MSCKGISSEDERYRTSTQYRLWSFSPSALLELRQTTNKTAADRVREAVRRAREARNSLTDSKKTSKQPGNVVSDEEFDFLTVEEELKLLVFYCRQTIQLGDHLGLPSDVKVSIGTDLFLSYDEATAIQYMKRFYLSNSLMTYHPTDILKTALFFATKSENFYFRLTKFADTIGKTKPEDVLASEFLLTQGLRFTFDVRHPYRALEGAIMELQALSRKSLPILPDNSEKIEERPKNMERRVKDAHGKAREYLKSSTLLTDVYFHFTPSQIMMAALLNADEDLVTWYLRQKFPVQESLETQKKILDTIRDCAVMLKTVNPRIEPSGEERKELQGLAKKLKKCRNPEKMDVLGLQRIKREGEEGYGENIVKKRKLESEISIKEADDIFGPKLK
ncbi:Cyclin CCL1 [Golovinomyces cichoracearum]|uniref:Cyclin CCL1 n=1 Tax=Golovinomyces cichoracearum TaxID=62708 RepID=A0A420IYB2_9PEZI|nr:Cyclin CCL1 [Golovinomyces cichoracearum]